MDWSNIPTKGIINMTKTKNRTFTLDEDQAEYLRIYLAMRIGRLFDKADDESKEELAFADTIFSILQQ
jgi:integrase